MEFEVKINNKPQRLMEEVQQLEKQLEDQFAVRFALEKAFASCHSCPRFDDHFEKNPIEKHVMDLIKEIAALETEVMWLEKRLLSLYRTITLDHHQKVMSLLDKQDKEQKVEHRDDDKEKFIESGICRSLSYRSQCSAFSLDTSPLTNLAHPVDSYHSLPLSMLEHAKGTSLAERLRSKIHSQEIENANWISEEMVKCMSSVYCELSDSRIFPSSSASFSSESDLSPLHTKTKEYSSTIEINFIYRNEQKLRGVRHMLWNYRTLVSRLEGVNPTTMKHEEKLAFWINVHNALVMHAYIIYGVSRNNTKRTSLILKAAYNIGGHTTSVEVIQSLILGCRLIHPGQWIQSLFFPKTKHKPGDIEKQFAIQHGEPRLYFALSCGKHSDPQIRVFTPKRVYEELEAAKDDYIQANIGIHKQCNINLPKIVDSFAKESCFGPAGLEETICPFLPDYVTKNSRRGKLSKRIKWTHHNFAFRYKISKEHVK